MNKSHLFSGAVSFVACACVGAVLAFGPEDPFEPGKKFKIKLKNGETMTATVSKPIDNSPDEMSPDEMMAAYMALGNPGEQHEAMKQSVGDWHAKTSFVMDSANPDEMQDGVGKVSVEMVMGGRFTKTKFDSDFMGVPFTGYAYSGYDNGRQQHVSIWMDTMSTAITYMTGNMNEDGDLVMVGNAFAPGVGDYQMKMVYHWDDENNWSQKFYDQLPDGSWMHTGVITYTRK